MKEKNIQCWVVTLPQTVPWEEYEEELRNAEEENLNLNFRVPHFPKKLKRGDRCYIVWKGKVRGWMYIVKTVEYENYWICHSTGRMWPKGKYIVRSGKFYEVENGAYMRGFQGIRSTTVQEMEGI